MTPHRVRLDSIDLLRGLVMVLMALDHTRDFFAAGGLDRARCERAYAVSHALDHALLRAGVRVPRRHISLSLWRARQDGARGGPISVHPRALAGAARSDGRALRLDLQRVPGLRAPTGDLGDRHLVMVLSGLIHLPHWAIGAVGIGIILGHNLLDGIQAEQLGPTGGCGTSCTSRAAAPGVGRSRVRALSADPLDRRDGSRVCVGPVMLLEPAHRRRRLVGLGVVVTVGFVLLRATNVYGDPAPWALRDTLSATVLSFLNTEKYPPSALYLAMTLGPALVALAGLAVDERQAGAVVHNLRARIPFLLCSASAAPAHAGGDLCRGRSWRYCLVVRWPADGGAGRPSPRAMGWDCPACMWRGDLWQRRFTCRAAGCGSQAAADRYVVALSVTVTWAPAFDCIAVRSTIACG